jgi:hypothetical protein
LIVAFLSVTSFTITDSFEFTIPSGWTRNETINLQTAGDSGVATRSNMMWKVADSSDVAASTFAFSHSGGAQTTTGLLIRISGDFKPSDPIDVDASLGTDAFPAGPWTPAIPLDPTNPNSLFIGYMFTFRGSGGNPTLTDFSIATSNPTWTITNNLTTNNGYEAATVTATRPEVTSSGNPTLTGTNMGNNSTFIWAVIKAVTNISETATTQYVTVNLPTASPNNGHTLTATTLALTLNLVTSTMTKWKNAGKNFVTWINQQRS